MHTHIKHIYIREPTVHADNYARVPRLDARALERVLCTMEYVNGCSRFRYASRNAYSRNSDTFFLALCSGH